MHLITDANRKWWILSAMGAGAGLIMLDETVVGVALPTLRDDLGMSKVAAHWVVSAYMLVFAGIAAASGRIGDIVGFKTLIIAGAAIFGLVSLAAGFAQDARSSLRRALLRALAQPSSFLPPLPCSCSSSPRNSAAWLSASWPR